MISTFSFLHFLIAHLAGKCTLLLTKILHIGNGTAAPGLIAQKIDQNILEKYIKQGKNMTIIITGTNGKTTTSRLIANYFSKHAIPYIHNKAGSNLERGIVSAYIHNATLIGKINPNSIGVWELDEAEFSKSLKKMNPKYIVLLNLFRDQLDRYGEIDTIRLKWEKAILSLTQKTTILYNGDDPHLCALAQHIAKQTNKHQLKAFSIEGNEIKNEEDIFDPLNLVLCPLCNNRLKFTERTITGQGKFHCLTCGFKNPNPELIMTKIHPIKTGTRFEIQYKNQHITDNAQLIGTYNMYNITAATILLLQENRELQEILHACRDIQGAFGRMETVKYKKRNFILILIKNPAGAQEALKTLNTKFKTCKYIACILNDNTADGKDVSWIWDVPWGKYIQKQKIITAGTRVYDMTIRLQYDDIEEKNITPITRTETLFEKICEKTSENQIIPIFATYTAMLNIQKICVKKGMKKNYLGEE